MAAGPEFADSEIQTLRNMELEGIRDTQFKSDDDAGEFCPFSGSGIVCLSGSLYVYGNHDTGYIEDALKSYT